MASNKSDSSTGWIKPVTQGSDITVSYSCSMNIEAIVIGTYTSLSTLAFGDTWYSFNTKISLRTLSSVWKAVSSLQTIVHDTLSWILICVNLANKSQKAFARFGKVVSAADC